MIKVMKALLAVTLLLFLFYSAQLKIKLLYVFLKNPLITLLVIILCYIMLILNSWRWYRLNNAQGVKLSFKYTTLLTYIGVAFNTILPGSFGGDMIRLFQIFKKLPANKSAAILSSIVDRLSGLAAILLIICIATPFYMKKFNGTSVHFLFENCIGVLILCFLSLLFFYFLFSKNLMILRATRAKIDKLRLFKHFNPFFQAIYAYRNNKKIISECLTISLATQVLFVLVVIIISNAMELPNISLADYMLAVSVAQMANLLPFTPGGIGIGEVAFANILLFLNPNTTGEYATVFLAARLLSALSYSPGIILGIFGNKFLLNHEPSSQFRTTT
jgi:glycosyltransferase 2 family protein